MNSTRSRFPVVGSLIVVAFVLRVLFLWLAGLNAPLVGDELAYQQIAENLAGGNGFVQTNNPFFPGEPLYAWQAPLFPLSIGLIYSFLGSNLLVAKFFGIVTSTATVYLVYDLARRVFRSPSDTGEGVDSTARIALAAGALAAIYPGFLTNAHLLLSETFFIFLLLLAFDFVARGMETTTSGGRMGLWLVSAGVAWGLAVLTRGVILYFTPLLGLWIGFVVFRGAQPLSRAAGWALVFVIAALVVISPWTLRNYTVLNGLVAVETKGGVNLWLGNSPFTPNDFIRNVWKVGVREPMLMALPPGELERDRAAYQFALNYIRAEPVTFAARLPIKFADFWGFERNLPDTAEATTRGDGWNSIAKLGADLFAISIYIIVLLAGVGGFVLAPNATGYPRIAWKLLFAAFLFYFLIAHLVIFGDGRFHLPLIPFFILYAGWLIGMWGRIKFSTERLVIAGLLAFILVLVWAREAVAALQILREG